MYKASDEKYKNSIIHKIYKIFKTIYNIIKLDNYYCLC